MTDATIRRATVSDVAVIADLRVAFLTEAGHAPDRDRLLRDVVPYLERTIASGEVVAFVAERSGEVVGTGVVTVYERMSWDGVSREGYVLSMYTLPALRGRGIGAAIVDAITSFARERDMRLCLIALDEARPLYERAGFAPDARYLRWRP